MTRATAPDTPRRLAPDRRAPAGDRLLVVRATLWLLAADLGLRTVGFTRLRRWLRRPPAPAAATGPAPDRRREARRLLDAVGRAGRFRLHRVPCLPRALVLQRLLAGRGIPSEVRIGVRREGGSLTAHAWVECGDLTLDPEPAAAGRFQALI